ncbi:MAG TPA: hypothetical protein PLI95_14495 [Polyangiaceae bacterium]|nr:hypothetical protein [Polyangiaceae bacterium]
MRSPFQAPLRHPAVIRIAALTLCTFALSACGETDEGPAKKPVVQMTDTDKDGVPDKCEPFFGTDPNKVDTDNNGLGDGQEDHDGDGYSNFHEMVPYADQDMCPPEPDGGKTDAAADVAAEAAQEAGEDAADTDAESDAEGTETGDDAAIADDASDAETTDAAAE